jgi:hypothetical protein
MTAPMNLTLKRGPSVWDAQRGTPVNWRLAAATGGMLITAFGLSSRSSRSNWLVSLGLCGVALSICGGRMASTVQAGSRALRGAGRTAQDHDIDRASEDSFPASDPPALHSPVAPV